MVQQQVVPSIYDINLRTRAGSVISLAVLAALLTVASTAHAQTLTVLHTFTGGADGAGPGAGLTRDGAGNFYGTAMDGGSGSGVCAASGCGTVFKLARHGSIWVLNPIYEFTSLNQGPFNPSAKVIFGPDGALYGTTVNGGSCSGGWCGTIFKLQPPRRFAGA